MVASWLICETYDFCGRKKCRRAAELESSLVSFSWSSILFTPMCLRGLKQSSTLFRHFNSYISPHLHTQKVTKLKDRQKPELKDRQQIGKILATHITGH